jgi:hypothetical protein
MKIEGTANQLVVSFERKHNAWKNEQTVLSVDALSVTLRQDGTIVLKSKDGRLVVSDDSFVLVHPGWYDAKSDIGVQSKTSVFKNSVACCYEVIQKSNNRKGYILVFKEQDNEVEQ